MIAALKPYLMVTRNSMMAGITYRAHFIFMAIGNIVYVVVAYFLWQAIYGANTSLNGLSLGQAYLQIAVSMGIYALLQNWVEWFISSQIQQGDVIRYLTRPLDYMYAMLADSAGGTAINCIGIAAPTIILAYALSGMAPPPLWAALACVAAVVLAFFISFCIDFLIGLLSFVTTTVWGISTTKEIIVLFASGAIIPLAFFPPSVQAVLEWLPFQAIYSAPLAFLLHPDLTAADLGLIFLRQVIWLLIIFGASRLAWRTMVRHLVINGG